MKNMACWRKEFFLVGIIVFLMLMMISCSNDTMNYSETGDDTHRTEQTGITTALTGIINALCGDDTNQDPTIFNTSCLPLDTNGYSYGSFAFDAEGNLLFEVSGVGEIRSLDRDTCTVTTVATGIYDMLGMTYDQGFIYVGLTNGNIYKVNRTTGSATLLTTISEDFINGLVIAPATFSPYGGQLIVATYSGKIYAVDLSVASPTPVQFAYTGTDASALVFDSSGTLYLADYMFNKIVTLTATGVVADFVTSGLNGPDGLAFGNNVLYVSNSGNSTLKSVTIPGGIVSTVTSINFNSGWYPSPIIYDADSNILLMGYSGSLGLTIGNYNF